MEDSYILGLTHEIVNLMIFIPVQEPTS